MTREWSHDFCQTRLLTRLVVYSICTRVKLVLYNLGKVRFFLVGVGGGEVEDWEILVILFKKIVGPPLRFNKNTPDKSATLPLTTTWYVPCRRNLRTFRL